MTGLPKPNAFYDDEGMMHRVRNGDIDRLRRYFDLTLKGEAVHRPRWPHLKIALEQNNLPMMRLLVTWGATPTEADLQALADELGDRSTAAFQKLRVAGLDLKSLPQPRPPTVKNDGLPDTALIPEEWKGVLKTLHANGMPEAMIVGGALRDTFNGRAVKDVDIFVKAPFFGNRRKLLGKVFAKAGLEIKTNSYCDHYTGREISRGSLEKVSKIPHAYDREKSGFGRIDAWRVVAGPQDTEYNIVFVNSPLADELRREASPKKVHPDNPASIVNFITRPALKEFLAKIDIGLCQIAFNGHKIITTGGYEADVKKKRITLINPGYSNLFHIERVAVKYPDFTQCPATRQALKTRKLPHDETKSDPHYLTNYVAVRAYM